MDGERHPWLVVGADGAIGGALLHRLRRDSIPAVGTSRRPAAGQGMFRLDLAAEPATWSLPHGVDVAFLCAAVTSIERCRQDPVGTRVVNVERTLELARRLHTCAAHVVFLSTNQVFDGSRPYRRENEPTCPRTEYGKQKAEVENALLAVDSTTTVRLTKVVPQRMKLLGEWAASLKAGRPIAPFHDMVIAPVPLDFAIRVLVKAGHVRWGGVLNVSGDMDVSYAEIAVRLARRLGVSGDLVQPISVEQAGMSREAAPRHTTLAGDVRMLERGLEPPPVWDTIDAIIEGVVHE